MITTRTKIQLLVFVVITLVGVTYAGARYAQLDRYFVDTSYEVVGHFEESGGIFVGGEVTYRGVKVGRVSDLELTSEGVDVTLEIENEWDEIPADAFALVGNRSAVGEQYVELQPASDDGPFFTDGDEIAMADTGTPIKTNTLLTNLSNTVESVDKDALRVTVSELGQAFGGTGRDLQKIIDTGNSFINEADANFETTLELIEDSTTVLNGQLRSESAIRNFSNQLALFSAEVASADGDLRRVIDSGSAAISQVRLLIEENEVQLGQLINRLVTTGEVFVDNLDGVEHVLVIYPYVVEGGFTVAAIDPDTGLYNAHFGLVIEEEPVCEQGYTPPSDRRDPNEGENVPMNEDAGCTEPATMSNPRGPQNLNRPDFVYNPETGKITSGSDVDTQLLDVDTVAPETLGEDSWKWLFMQPMTAR